MAILTSDWEPLLRLEFEQPYYRRLREFLKEEYRSRIIHPDMYDIYSALQLTSYSETRVVILGQDPYHGTEQAHGLSFSVKPGVAIPPSLLNMFKELHDDLGCFIPNNGFLEKWAKQGVLLLNAVLTVRDGLPNSHKGQGWETFTGRVIETLNRREKPAVFILWGSQAQAKLELIDAAKHHVIRSPHPSPLSAHRGFFGSKPFSRANAFLRSIGEAEIDWQIENIKIQ